MNNNYRFLCWSGTLALLILSLFLLTATNQVKNNPAANTISFSGEGKVNAKPDIALIRVVIFNEALTSKEAEKALAPRSKAMVDFLKKQGIEEKDIKTVEYNIIPQYAYPERESPKIRSYQAYQELEVKIKDIDKASEIVDGAVNAEANKVTDLRFTIDEPEKLQAEARAKAIADAKKKADELEDQLGIRLGKIVNFSENTGGYPIPYYLEAKEVSGGVGSAIPEIPTGENEIKVDVSITYQIK